MTLSLLLSLLFVCVRLLPVLIP